MYTIDILYAISTYMYCITKYNFREVNLSSNGLTVFPVAFAGLRHLDLLNLAKNRITKVTTRKNRITMVTTRKNRITPRITPRKLNNTSKKIE